MTLYYFNPNDYGEEYFVMHDNNVDALISLKLHLKEQMEHPDNAGRSSYRSEYERWEGASVDNLPGEYSIDEYKTGQVAEAYNG